MSEAMTTPGAPSWIEHSGPDPDRARAFYSSVLDWSVGDLPMKDGSNYPGILVGEQPVGGFSPRPVQRGGWLIYVTVDDVDARFRTALDQGAQEVMAPASVPGVGRMATFQDPFGATLAMIEYEPADD